MSHLPIERLAALADEQPGADEASHLATCAECARELEAIRSLVSLAGAERESMSVPLTRWDTLAAKLRSEGLVATGGYAQRTAHNASRVVLQFAAGLLLVAGGVAAGRVSAGAAMVPGGLSGSGQSQVASGDSVKMTFASATEAARYQQLYQEGYQSAIDYLAKADSSAPTPAAMRTRLSALDRASRTMREALREAPADPVINSFYLNSFTQREATLRALNTALPQGVRLNSF